jgi:lipoprotein-anchoring transpeptidase ErfK/SrfK
MRARIRVAVAAALAATVVVTGCGTADSVAGPASRPEPTVTAAPITPNAVPPPANPDLRAPIFRASTAYLVEQRLAALGYPTGTVDGVVSVRTRQALCAWRDTHGLTVTRSGLTSNLARAILAAPSSRATKRPDGLYISKTCQVLFQVVNGKNRRIVWVSTAQPGYTTPSGTGRVWRKWPGGHESSLYSDAWMYDSLYFRRDHPGIALHGSASNSLVHSYPASHGCVRVWRPTIHSIFNETPIGTRVVVYGAY